MRFFALLNREAVIILFRILLLYLLSFVPCSFPFYTPPTFAGGGYLDSQAANFSLKSDYLERFLGPSGAMIRTKVDMHGENLNHITLVERTFYCANYIIPTVVIPAN